MSGLARNFGTMTKPFHAGHAARTGYVSAWMAKNGLTASAAILDDKGGVQVGLGAVQLVVGGLIQLPWYKTNNRHTE